MKDNHAGISFFQRYLTVWVFLCMVVGVLLGHFTPALPELLNHFEYARVSILLSQIHFFQCVSFEKSRPG